MRLPLSRSRFIAENQLSTQYKCLLSLFRISSETGKKTFYTALIVALESSFSSAL
jgi:hypothetical protein